MNLVEIGDHIEHALMGWHGVVVCDLRSNPLCSQHWKVKFNVDGKLTEKNVFEAELKTRTKGE